MSHQSILILDFGSQYTQLIARRIREQHVYCEILPFTAPMATIRALAPTGVVLSGGPNSVYEDGAPTISTEIYQLGVPVLGICYGAQLTARLLGGDVRPAAKREYGRAEITITASSALLGTIAPDEHLDVWMSHGDHVEGLPPGFTRIASSPNCPMTAFADEGRRIYAVQFHPEVVHTPRGAELIGNFLTLCGCRGDWSMASFIDEATAKIQAQVGPTSRVICGLSGGVDSSVAAAILHRALGTRLTCIFVDNGLLRRGERDQVDLMVRTHFPDVELRVIDAEARFLTALAGVTDPETKRKIIGVEFVRVFEEAASTIDGARFLAQGTLYPDVIESVSVRGGPSHVIKSHHNVGGLPERMNLTLVEPLRELFKDEVRKLGLELGLPQVMVGRQPFPGPGLAVRCLGDLIKPRLDVLRAADAVIEEEIRGAGLYEQIWQSFGVLLPVRSVGVMGDARTYEETLALRAVYSKDGMTADWVPLPYDLLGRISNRIINEVRGINRVVYDITSKPPGTIEWE